MKDKHICCFGELLLRLSPVLQGEWIKNTSMPVYVGGAELNVAQALAHWNLPVKYCTVLPDQYLSKELCMSLEERHIDVSSVHWAGERIGTYYLPQGNDLKNQSLIYNREHSSFSELKPGMIKWKEVFKNVSWFHFSAINPALNQQIADVCEEALIVAHQMGITVSVDLNYRSKLWNYGKEPKDIMSKLLPYCNVVMGNIWAAESLLGVPLQKEVEARSRAAFLNQSAATAQAIMKKFPACKVVANTFRFDEVDGLRYYATLETGGKQYVSPEFNANQVINKIGSGDCFMAGLIYESYKKESPQDIINFASAAAFGKFQEPGDATSQTTHDIRTIINNYGKKDAAMQQVLKQGILPLFFHQDEQVSIEILKALYAAGVRAVEYTNRGTMALSNFKAMKKIRDLSMPDMQIGIGTLKNANDARTFAQAGADFLVSPGFVDEIAEVANKYKLLWIPGCMTVSEIIAAENAGMYLIKLFPANVLGTAFIESIRSIFPSMHFMPTGGVDMNEENIKSLFKAGVSAIGIGNILINKKVLEQDDYTKVITNLTIKAIKIIQNTQKKGLNEKSKNR